MNRCGYQGVGEVPEEDGWQIHIYFGKKELRILHRKQCRKYRDKKGKHEVEFVIDWEMDVVYNLNADKCLFVGIQIIYDVHFPINDKLHFMFSFFISIFPTLFPV